ncbi:hypothetical protein L2E82_39023 [Cichorium intybus]|uniref:Uncharacterized protein n=1 Tax=Cichorium intybus TaxID=13427 RepID=A0ACB9AIR8_CICIN|nr:hypothetical protein L2E82_39023 [Cichorium intybus]
MAAHESDRASENPKPPSNVAESNDGSSRHSSHSHKSKSHWGLSTAVHGVGFVAKKMVNNRITDSMVNNRITDSIWSIKKSSSSSSNSHVPSDTSSKKENNISHEIVSDQTSKPSLNVSDEQSQQTAKVHGSSKHTHTLERLKNKVKDVFDHSENSMPPDPSYCRLPNRHPQNSNVVDDSENLKSPDGSDVSTTSCNVVDHSEASKHQDGSNVRVVNQQRWPNTISSNVVDNSGTSKPPNVSHVKPVTQHLWPSTVGSSVLSKNSNPPEEVSKTCIIPDRRMLQESDPTTESQPSTPNKSHGISSRGASPVPGISSRGASPAPGISSRGASPSPALRGASLIPPSVRGVSLTPAIRGASLTPATRGVSLTPKRVDYTSATRVTGVDPLITRGVGPSVAGRGPSPTPKRVDPISATRETGVDPLITKGVGPSVASRGPSPTPATKVPNLIPLPRGVSPTPATKPVNPIYPLPEFHTPLHTPIHTPLNSMPSSPTDSLDSNTVSRGASPPGPSSIPTSPTYNTRGVSPTPSRHHSDLADIGRRVIYRARGVSPIPLKSSGSTRHFFSTSLLSMFTSTKKEKIMAERKEASQSLELLQTVQAQWQFLNAETEASLNLQRINSEKSLFDMWRTILELRDSVAAMKIDIIVSILQLKLYAVLYRQMAFIDKWALIEREHESALTATVNDLVTRSILLPIIGGVNVKADIKLLKFIVCSSVEVMQTTISSIQSTLAKVGGTRHLASELVNVALHERALLDECEIFLASAAPLQIEECSLRSYLIQLNQSYNSE